MDRDNKLIFEAYQHITEAPVEMGGDIDVSPVTSKTLPGQGKGYGAGAISKIAAATGKPETEIAKEMAQTILDYTKERKVVDGKEVYFFPGDPKTFINELTPIFKDKFNIPTSMAGFTVNYILIYLLNAKKISGGLKMDAEKVKAQKQAKATEPKTVKTETVYEIDKAAKVADKKIKAIVLALPDEDIPEHEVLSAVKTAISEYNEAPGRDKADQLKIRSFDLLDQLVAAGVMVPKKKEIETKEGEGTGEVETIEDFPEGDDVSSVARELGMVGRGRGFDPGGFSFND